MESQRIGSSQPERAPFQSPAHAHAAKQPALIGSPRTDQGTLQQSQDAVQQVSSAQLQEQQQLINAIVSNPAQQDQSDLTRRGTEKITADQPLQGIPSIDEQLAAEGQLSSIPSAVRQAQLKRREADAEALDADEQYDEYDLSESSHEPIADTDVSNVSSTSAGVSERLQTAASTMNEGLRTAQRTVRNANDYVVGRVAPLMNEAKSMYEEASSSAPPVPTVPLSKVGDVITASTAVLFNGLSNLAARIQGQMPTVQEHASRIATVVAPHVRQGARVAASGASQASKQLQQAGTRLTQAASAGVPQVKQAIGQAAESARQTGTVVVNRTKAMLPSKSRRTSQKEGSSLSREDAHRRLPLYRTEGDIATEQNTIGAKIQSGLRDTEAKIRNALPSTAMAKLSVQSATQTVKSTAQNAATAVQSAIPSVMKPGRTEQAESSTTTASTTSTTEQQPSVISRMAEHASSMSSSVQQSISSATSKLSSGIRGATSSTTSAAPATSDVRTPVLATRYDHSTVASYLDADHADGATGSTAGSASASDGTHTHTAVPPIGDFGLGTSGATGSSISGASLGMSNTAPLTSGTTLGGVNSASLLPSQVASTHMHTHAHGDAQAARMPLGMTAHTHTHILEDPAAVPSATPGLSAMFGNATQTRVPGNP